MAPVVAKLASLWARSISKPIANGLKSAAADRPRFRRLIISLAQGFNLGTRKLLGPSKPLEIRLLNEEKAVQSATDLLGELFISSVAGCAIIYEVQRSSRVEAKKEERRKKDLQAMWQKNEELAAEVKLLKESMQKLESSVTHTSAFRIFKWRDYQNPKVP